jgi:hypothetical protein
MVPLKCLLNTKKLIAMTPGFHNHEHFLAISVLCLVTEVILNPKKARDDAMKYSIEVGI